MSSLVPGTIFLSSGFNRKSTPTPRSATPDQLNQIYKKEDYNGRDWPADSPVSRYYDVANTSTKLIILNNKYGQNSTRLRGYYTGPKKPDRPINPDRHRAKSPRDPRYHVACLDSSSPKFEPTIKTDLEWLSSSQRPPNALIGPYLYLIKSSVNPRRHATCLASPDMNIQHERPHSRLSLPAKYLYNSEYADMSIGERIYLWSIEKIYNVEKMKKLKQEQYQKLLDGEAKKGYHSHGEYARYRRYISSASDRKYGAGSPSASSRRSKSAYSQRSRSSLGKSKSESKAEKDQEQTERPKTSIGHSRKESRDRSKSPEPVQRNRSPSVESEDRKQNDKTSQRKSPASATSRKSSARSQRSQISPTRSKSGSRVSSKASLKSADKTKGDNSETTGEKSDTKESGNTEQVHHKEGKDRPKSRLGHPGADDKDRDSLHSSNLSIKSDNEGSSSDSGREKQTREKNVKKLNSSPAQQKNTTDNGSDRKFDSDNRQSNNRGNTRGNRNMGSRVSVGSRGSKSSENERNKTNGQRSVIDNKENENEKVHRIPSAAYIENEANDEKSEEKDMKKENKDSTNEPKDNLENSGSSDRNDEKADTEKDDNATNGQEKEIDQENEINEDLRKSDPEVKDDSNVTADSNKDKNTEPVDKNKDESDDNGKKDEEINESDERKIDEQNKVRNKLSRQDSFDEEDDDRKVNKDLDKIEY